MIYTDTDSFIYVIQTDDVYKWMQENKQYFDLSESSLDWLQDDENKKKLGCFKDENNSHLVRSIIALAPKAYAYTFDQEHQKNCVKKVLKGVSKAVIKNDIKAEDYMHVLNTGEQITKEVTTIRSIKHEVFTIKSNKVALSSYYDKASTEDGINCLPFGYKSTERDPERYSLY